MSRRKSAADGNIHVPEVPFPKHLCDAAVSKIGDAVREITDNHSLDLVEKTGELESEELPVDIVECLFHILNEKYDILLRREILFCRKKRGEGTDVASEKDAFGISLFQKVSTVETV